MTKTNSTLNKKAFRLCGKRLFPLVELPRLGKALQKRPAKKESAYAKEGTDARMLKFIMRRHSNLEKAKPKPQKMAW